MKCFHIHCPRCKGEIAVDLRTARWMNECRMCRYRGLSKIFAPLILKYDTKMRKRAVRLGRVIAEYFPKWKDPAELLLEISHDEVLREKFNKGYRRGADGRDRR